MEEGLREKVFNFLKREGGIDDKLNALPRRVYSQQQTPFPSNTGQAR